MRNDSHFSQFRVLIFLAVFSALPSFFVPIMHTDEGLWAALSQYAFSGDLFLHFTDHKPPFLFQIFWLFSLGMKSLYFMHFSTALWQGIAACGLYRGLHSFVDSKTALWTAAIFSILSGLPSHGAFSAERAYIPFLIWAAVLAHEIYLEKISWRWSTLVGLCIGAATSIKHTAAPPCMLALWFLIMSKKHRVSSISLALFSALVFTAISWLATFVSFDVILHESFLANFDYIQFHSSEPWAFLYDVFLNFSLVMGAYFGPFTLCCLISIALTWKKWTRMKPEYQVALLILALGSLFSLSLGGRFYQQYYTGILPLMALGAAFSLHYRFLRQSLLVVSLGICIGFQIQFFTSYFSDRYKNWDSLVQNLIESVKADTKENETIWIAHNLQAVYALSERRPAVKFLQFSHWNHYADPCKSLPQDIREDSENPKFQFTLKQLEENKPGIVFWPQRAANSCSDLLKIDRFPSIKNFLEQNYDLKWKNTLGLYFIRRT